MKRCKILCFRAAQTSKHQQLNMGCAEKSKPEKFLLKKKSAVNSHFYDCALVVNNEFPFLAATPDGKICEDGELGLLEITCPYLARDMLISEAYVEINKFMLIEHNGKVSLDKSHDYYIQV